MILQIIGIIVIIAAIIAAAYYLKDDLLKLFPMQPDDSATSQTGIASIDTSSFQSYQSSTSAPRASLKQNTALLFGESFTSTSSINVIYSPNGMYSLSLEHTGELGIRKGGQRLWRTWNFNAVNERDIALSALQPTVTVTDQGLSVRDKTRRQLYELLPVGYAAALNCKISQVRVTDQGVLQVIAVPLSADATIYHSKQRQLPDNQIILWQSSQQKLFAWHVSSGLQIDSLNHLGSQSDTVLCVYKNKIQVLSTHPDFYRVSNMSADQGVQLIGDPVVVGNVGGIGNISCDYAKMVLDSSGKATVQIYESATLKETIYLSPNTYYIYLTPEGYLYAKGAYGEELVASADPDKPRLLIKPITGQSFAQFKTPAELIHPRLPFSALIGTDGAVDVYVKHASQGVFYKRSSVPSQSAKVPASDGILMFVFGQFVWATYKGSDPGAATGKDTFSICAYDKLPADVQFAPGYYALIENAKQVNRLTNVPPTDIGTLFSADPQKQQELTARQIDKAATDKMYVRMRVTFTQGGLGGFPDAVRLTDSGSLAIMQNNGILFEF